MPTVGANARIVADKTVDDMAVISASYPFITTNSFAGHAKNINAVLLPVHRSSPHIVTEERNANESPMRMSALTGVISRN